MIVINVQCMSNVDFTKEIAVLIYASLIILRGSNYMIITFITGFMVLTVCYLMVIIMAAIEDNDLEWIYVVIPLTFILGLLVRYLFNF